MLIIEDKTADVSERKSLLLSKMYIIVYHKIYSLKQGKK